MSPMSKRLKLTATMLAVVAAVAVPIAVTEAAASRHRATNHGSVSVSARLARIFGVLGWHGSARVAAATTQPLPAAVIKGMNSQPGVDPSQAVYAGGRYPTWVVPGDNEICLVAGAIGALGVPSSVCGPVSRAESGLILLTETDSGQPVVLGLAPNADSSVTVTDEDGATEDIGVKSNVFEITRGRPATVSLKDAEGKPSKRSVVISAPPQPTRPG